LLPERRDQCRRRLVREQQGFEEYCHVPKASVSKADCQTCKHQIEVYRKPRGAAEFEKSPMRCSRT